jgi:nickel-dependent lactate racemase
VKIAIGPHESFDEIEIPDRNLVGVYGPSAAPEHDERALLTRALERPLDRPGLDEFLAEAGDVVVLVNDPSRSTPTAMALEQVWDCFGERQVTVVVATGSHRAPDEEGLRYIFGGMLPHVRPHIRIHRARDDEMASLGRTSRGTEVAINARVRDASRVVVIGSVEPHYFAGFTGGRKSFLPGVSAYRTIEGNHRLALLSEARCLALEGNPVHEDMLEAMGIIGEENVFALQFVVDGAHRVASVHAGAPDATFAASIGPAKAIASVPLAGLMDVVIAVVYPPMDIDLYQSHKAIQHASLAVRDGGILILVSSCRGGLGPTKFYEILAEVDDPRAVGEVISKRPYRLGDHTAARFAAVLDRIRVWAVTDLPPGVLEDLFVEPHSELQQAVERALAETGPDARLLVLTSATVVVPDVASGASVRG